MSASVRRPSRSRIHAHCGALSGKKAKCRNGVHCARNRISCHSSSHPSRGADTGAFNLLASVSLLLVAGAPFAAGAAMRAARD